MKKENRVKLVVANKQKTRQVQRYIIAGSVFSVFGFFCALMYWNLGVNSDAKAGISYSWNGSSDSLWTNPSNWTPNGVPTNADDITIPSTPRIPIVNANVTLNSLNLSTNAQIDFNGFDVTVANSFTSNAGTIIQLRGKNLTINGSANLYGGTINENVAGGNVIINGPSTNFGNSAGGPIINSSITAVTGRITLRNTTFNGTTSLTKSDVGNDAAAGNNTFNGITTISNTSTSYLLFANSTRDIFNSTLTINTSSSALIYMSYNGVNTQFNDNVLVNCTGTGGIRFGASNGTATLASGKTISVGSQGFSGGGLQLSKITFDGIGDQDFQLTGTAILTLGPATTFNGNVTSVGPGLCLNGATFNSRFTAERNGTASNSGSGGNVFNGITQITNSGTGYVLLSNSTPDVFNADVTFNSTNSGNIHVAYRGTGNAFNQNVYVNSTSTGAVRFGSSNGTSLFATGKNIFVGMQGFTNGTLQLSGISYGDVAPKSFVLGSSATLMLGPNTTFGGDVNCNSGGLYLSGAIFNGKLTAVKTGATNDPGIGGNVYNDSVSLRNEGTGYLLLSNSTNDVFNSFASFNSVNSGIIYVAHRGTNTEFNDHVEVSSSGSGGVRFSTSTGSSSLAAGKIISTGSEGFSSGNLMIGRVTQLGNTAQNINLSGSGIVTFGPDVNIAGKLNVVAGGIALNGGTFADDVVFVKNGTSNEAGLGGCTFNGSLSITNNGTGYFLSSNSTNDIYNGKVTARITNSGIIYLAHRGTNTLFNDNVELLSSGSGSIRIGNSTGTSTLADGKIIMLDSTTFTNGYVSMARMSFGSNTQTFTMGAAATINLGPEFTMNGRWDFAGGGIRLNNCTFNQEVNLIKTGTMNDESNGNNTFMKPLSITNYSSGYFLFARTTKDIFNDDVTTYSNGSGIIYLAYNDSSTQFNGNVIVNSTGSGGIRFGGGNGVAHLAASKSLSIGTVGFTSGELNLRKFRQVDNTPINLNVSAGTGAIYFNTGSIFNGTVNVSFPQMYLNGTTFNAPISLEKNGAGSNTSTGGNVYNGNATIVNSGTSTMILSNSTADDFNANVIFTQNGTGLLYPAYNAACTFSGDITVNGNAATLTMSHLTNGRVVMDGTGAQRISSVPSMALTIRRLEMNNSSSGLTLQSPLNVSNVLIMTNGVITSSASNKLSIGTGVTSVTSVSDLSYVDGPVEKIGNTAFTFPTGKGGLYRPIGMTAPVSATDRFTADYFTANPNASFPIANKEASLHAVSRCEYWSFVRNAGTANVRMVLSWRDPVSCGITNINDLRVARWDTTAAEWKDLGNGSVTGNASAGTITANLGSAPYFVFTLGSSSAANSLPVDLVSFSAVKDGNAVLLKWITASEKNNDYFTIEKSQNANDFVEVERVNGYGNSTISRVYQFVDDNPFSGISYYRLRQTDFNGAFELFNPIMINFEGEVSELKTSTVGPNPFSNELHVNVFSPSSLNGELIIYNSVGNISYRQSISLNEGSNTLDINIENDLPPGIYFLKISTLDKSTEPFKLIRK